MAFKRLVCNRMNILKSLYKVFSLLLLGNKLETSAKLIDARELYP